MFNLDVPRSVSINRFEANESGEGVFRNGNHISLRNEPLHQGLFGLLENSYTSRAGIYHKCGRVVFLSTWGNERRMNNIGHTGGIPLFVTPAVSLRTPS